MCTIFDKNKLIMKYTNFIEFTKSKGFDNYQKYLYKYKDNIDFIMLYHLDKIKVKPLTKQFKNIFLDQLSTANILYEDMTIMYDNFIDFISF